MWAWLAQLTMCHEFLISRFVSLRETASSSLERKDDLKQNSS